MLSDSKLVYVFLLSHVYYMHRPSHIPRFLRPYNIWRVEIVNPLIIILYPASCHLSPLGPNILHRALNLCYSLDVRDQIYDL
jgi:hypothetical protein